MTWGAPIAWLGLLTLAVPILVHLLARRTRRRVAFPTLRFVDPSRLTPTRRRRITDPVLLAVRLAVLLVAVAALAQPWWPTAARSAAAADHLTRAIVVDASDSMNAATPDGRTGLAAARDAAVQLADGVDSARVTEVADVRAGLTEAAAWLATRGGRREVAVISDFQRGTLDAADVRLLDPAIGLRFAQIDPERPDGVVSFDADGRRTMASASEEDGDVVLTWRSDTGSEAADAGDSLRLAAPASDVPMLQRIRASALGLNPSRVTGGPVTVVLPDAPERPALLATARDIDAAWMFDVVDAIRRDPAAVDAARAATAGAATEDGAAALLAVVSAPDGRVLARAGAIGADDTDRLLIALEVGAGHPLTAAILAATPTAQPVAAAAERDPVRVSTDTLTTWEREPTAVAATAADLRGASDGRWLWLAALILLAVETWLRRQAPTTSETPSARPREEHHARVA